MDGSGATGFGIGQPVRRKEDARLLTGKGRYGDDFTLPQSAHAVFVRSPHAHARIVSIGKAAALAAPGVLAVLTGADYVADGLLPIPHNVGLMQPPDVAVRLRAAPVATGHYPLPPDKVRFVGEQVALVIAETIAAAKNAAELLDVSYDVLPAVAYAADAVRPGAPLLWDAAPGNVCIDIEVGNEVATTAAFDRAAHVVRLETLALGPLPAPLTPAGANTRSTPAAAVGFQR
jgi:carbon-monoxide dehydrogenase large subunit